MGGGVQDVDSLARSILDAIFHQQPLNLGSLHLEWKPVDYTYTPQPIGAAAAISDIAHTRPPTITSRHLGFALFWDQGPTLTDLINGTVAQFHNLVLSGTAAAQSLLQDLPNLAGVDDGYAWADPVIWCTHHGVHM